MERFWEIDQSHIREELARRGFLIYENGHLRNAAGTPTAMIMLLSPAFYDSDFNVLTTVLDETVGDIVITVESTLFHDFNFIANVYPYFELFTAFLAAGYKIEGVNEWWNVLDIERVRGDYYYLRGLRKLWHDFIRTELPDLLNATTPLDFSRIQRAHRSEAVYLPTEDASNLPRFVWMYYYITSPTHWRQFDSDYRGDITARIDLYPYAFERVINGMMADIDEILARNPDAVIILQSDHGLHISATQDHLLAIGLPHDTIMDLIHSVFSAVRIPESYGGLDTPIAPINITRELVNRFVGQNYEMIEAHVSPKR